MSFEHQKECWAKQITLPQALIALLTASIMPTVALGALSLSMSVARIVLVIVLAHGLILGLPAFLVLRAKGWLNRWACAITGVAIAVLPIGILTWPLSYGDMGSNAWVGIDRVQVLADGVPTLAGWLQYFLFVGIFGVLGLVAGLQFWSVAKEQMVENHNYATGVYAQEDGEGFSKFRRRVYRHSGEIFAFIFVVMVLLWPTVFADRSCHNMFQHGSRFTPIYGFKLSIGQSSWEELAGVMREFADQNDLSYRKIVETNDEVVDMLYLSVCSESGVNIEVNEQHWKRSQHRTSFEEKEKVAVYIYPVKEGAPWTDLAMPLEDALERNWPERLTIDDRRE